MKIICVTGTPGTGKTTVAQRLAKKGSFRYVDVNAVIAKQKLSEGYDRKNKCKIVDVKKLSRAILDHVKNEKIDVAVVDSHLSHYIPAKSVALCLVTKCNLKLLKQRMKRRGYSDNKIKENLECEIMDVCLSDAAYAGHNTFVVETDSKVDYEKLVRKIKRLK
jgi:adenylate kinase